MNISTNKLSTELEAIVEVVNNSKDSTPFTPFSFGAGEESISAKLTDMAMGHRLCSDISSIIKNPEVQTLLSDETRSIETRELFKRCGFDYVSTSTCGSQVTITSEAVDGHFIIEYLSVNYYQDSRKKY